MAFPLVYPTFITIAAGTTVIPAGWDNLAIFPSSGNSYTLTNVVGQTLSFSVALVLGLENTPNKLGEEWDAISITAVGGPVYVIQNGNALPAGSGSGGGGGSTTIKDFEETIWVDGSGTGTTYIRRVELDVNLNTYTTTFMLPNGTPYVPVGTSVPHSDDVVRIYNISGGNDFVLSTLAGNTFQLFQAHSCTSVTVVNNTGTNIEIQQNAGGVSIPVLAGSYLTFQGITNANQLGARRIDLSGTQVRVDYRYEL